MRIRKALAAAALATTAATAGALPAQAAPIPGIDHTLQIDARLRLVGVNPVDIPGYSTKVCDTLRNDPTAEGKRAALDLLATDYPHPMAQGYALGVMADVRCDDTVPLLRDIPAAPAGTPAAQEIASQADNDAAMSSWSAKVGVATTAGSLIGAGTGFVLGCAIGGVVTSPTLVFIPLGCLTGGVTGAGIGGVLGTLIVGGPTAVIAGIEMVQVLLTPTAAK
ncbi:hypothetical protein [Nocardia sp. CA-290969]|uniref:hypothetical protein n=1 Tax=Nocardia sp. CA-290969 TaxID=3239986 RepID=UPI003D926561